VDSVNGLLTSSWKLMLDLLAVFNGWGRLAGEPGSALLNGGGDPIDAPANSSLQALLALLTFFTRLLRLADSMLLQDAGVASGKEPGNSFLQTLPESLASHSSLQEPLAFFKESQRSASALLLLEDDGATLGKPWSWRLGNTFGRSGNSSAAVLLLATFCNNGSSGDGDLRADLRGDEPLELLDSCWGFGLATRPGETVPTLALDGESSSTVAETSSAELATCWAEILVKGASFAFLLLISTKILFHLWSQLGRGPLKGDGPQKPFMACWHEDLP